MLNFALCDDNNNVLIKLERMLESIFINKSYDGQIVLSTTKPDELINYVRDNNVNVIFLDIDLKSKISGLDLANIIRKKDKNIYIIFTTGHLEYGLIAYKYKTFDYLPKPITLERLEDTLVRLFEDISGMQSNFIRLDNDKTIIKQDGIQYIKKDGMKVIFHTDTREYETYSSFKKILPQLPNSFIQCHKSYIVNLDKITDINMTNGTILLNNSTDDKCYIGPKYKNHFLEVFNNGNFSSKFNSSYNIK